MSNISKRHPLPPPRPNQVRLLVTHGVQYLPSTDHVVVMEDGRVTESGHYEKLLAHSGPFAKLITNYLTQQDPDKEVSNKNGKLIMKYG